MIVVQKFGGTSVLGIERIKASCEIVKKNVEANIKVVVVVSAMAGETDRLLSLYKEACINNIENEDLLAEMDSIACTGEQVCAGLFACMLTNLGIKARSFTGISAGILTDANYTKAKISNINLQEVEEAMNLGYTPIITGFQGFCVKTLRQTTLGRGGSDTSALAIAAYLKASKCEIYKDVDGVLSGDPKIIEKPYKIDTLNYDSMLEIASSGTKVLEIKSVNFASKYGIKTEVKSSFDSKNGTEINSIVNETASIQNISFSEKECLVKIHIKDFANLEKKKISFKILSIEENQIANILISKADFSKIESAINVVQISIIGVFLRSDQIMQKVLSIILSFKINLLLATSSETRIILILEEKNIEDIKSAYKVIHTNLVI